MRNDIVKKVILITGQTCLTALAAVTLYRLVEEYFYRKFSDEIYDDAYQDGVDAAYSDMEENAQDESLCEECRCNGYCRCSYDTSTSEVGNNDEKADANAEVGTEAEAKDEK